MKPLLHAPRDPGTRLAASLLVAMSLAAPAAATPELTLTTAGIVDGFTLDTFATLSNPYGVAVTGTNQLTATVIVGGFSPFRYVWNDVDGQTVVPPTFLFSRPSGSGSQGFASAGGLAYGGESGSFVQFNADGTVNHIIAAGYFNHFGMWGAPNGHIIAGSSAAGLIDIDPLANGGAGSVRVINATVSGNDGVSVSPDGNTAYVEIGGSIQAVRISDGVLGTLYTGFNSPDGTAVISGGTFDNYLIVNNNNGDVDLQNLLTPGSFTTIATGATRGDYVSADPATCTVFLSESNSVMRLGIPGACIGASIPEPASIALLAIAFAGLGFSRRQSN